MAVSKLWSVTSRLGQVIDYAANPEKTAADIYTEEQYQALRDVLSYAKDEEKTEREFFVEGINCNPATARDQFVSVKKAYGKDDGILLPSLRRLSKSVMLWKKTSRQNPRTKSSQRKQSESLFRKRGTPSQTPQSPKRTKTLRQGKTQSR